MWNKRIKIAYVYTAVPLCVQIASEPSPPKVPTKQRRSSITQLQQQSSNRGTPPPLQHSQSLQVETPPTVPSRRGQSSTPTGSPARSRPTSFSSSGEEGGGSSADLPRPPPRVTSVRATPGHLSRSKAQGSRESLDKMSPSSSTSNLTASLVSTRCSVLYSKQISRNI